MSKTKSIVHGLAVWMPVVASIILEERSRNKFKDAIMSEMEDIRNDISDIKSSISQSADTSEA